MNLLRTSAYTSLSTAISFLSGFVVAKVVAVKIGPAGVAMVGQYQNMVAIATMLGTAAANVGIVKLLAEHGDNPAHQATIVRSVLRLSLICSVVVGLIVVLGSRPLSNYLFDTPEYATVVAVFGVTLFFISGNVVAGAILNGLKRIRDLTISNVAASLIGIAVIAVSAIHLGVKGVLIATSISGLLMWVVNYFIVSRLISVNFLDIRKAFHAETVRRLLSFSLMAFFSGLLGPLSQFFVRRYIIGNLSMQDAGYWQSMTRISDYYLAFITSVLGVYYLPRMSEAKDRAELRGEVIKGYKQIIPIVAAMALSIVLFKDTIIVLLFSREFMPMNVLFEFQMLGDVLKMASWIIAFIMLAKGLTKMYIGTELVFTTTFIILSVFFVRQYGLVGTTYAFCINNAAYLVTIFLLLRKRYI